MPNLQTTLCLSCSVGIQGYNRVLINYPDTDTLGYICYECHDKLRGNYTDEVLFNTKCPSCGCSRSVDDLRSISSSNSGSTFMCRECYAKIYWYCTRCDQEFTHENTSPVLIRNDYGHEMMFCLSCAERYRKESIIHQFDYIPKMRFYKEENEYMNLLYLGIELELESCDNNRYELAKTLPDFVYAKHDGSLTDGFEIVSYPATYRWLMSNKVMWNKMLEVRKQGWRSFNTETCGMHIHLSKVAFGNHHLYKFMKLFYSNPDFILKISQRESKKHLKQYSNIELTDRRVKLRAKAKRTLEHDDRYTAINLNTPDTVEVRIFRGTLLAESFWKNIEFVKAAYEFSYRYNSNYMTEISFRKYLRLNKKEFKNLYNFLYEDNNLKVYNEGVNV